MKPQEFPGSLSSLQFDLLRSFPQSDFFLTGGGSLIGFYGHNRTTRDLGLFTRDRDAFDEGTAALKEAASQVGATLEALRTTPHFRRFQATRGEEETLIDLVWESVPAVYPPTQLPDFTIKIDTPEELAVNKVCAILGRAEPRDLDDLRFLAALHVDIDRAVRQAPQKDSGIGMDTLLMTLQGISETGLDAKTQEFRSRWMASLKLELLPPE